MKIQQNQKQGEKEMKKKAKACHFSGYVYFNSMNYKVQGDSSKPYIRIIGETAEYADALPPRKLSWIQRAIRWAIKEV